LCDPEKYSISPNPFAPKRYSYPQTSYLQKRLFQPQKIKIRPKKYFGDKKAGMMISSGDEKIHSGVRMKISFLR
jgi:hypothetical protein